MVRPFSAATVSSTKPLSLRRVGVDHHLDVEVVADRRGSSRWPPVWCPSPHAAEAQQAPAGDLLDQGAREAGVALAREKPMFIGQPSAGLDHARQVPGAGRGGGGLRAGQRRPRAGRSSMQVTPARRGRPRPAAGQDEVACGESIAPGGSAILPSAADDLCPRADDDVDAASGCPGRCFGLAVDFVRCGSLRQAHVGLHDPPVVDDQGVGDDRCRPRPRRAGRPALWPMPSRTTLAAPEGDLLAVGGGGLSRPTSMKSSVSARRTRSCRRSEPNMAPQ